MFPQAIFLDNQGARANPFFHYSFSSNLSHILQSMQQNINTFLLAISYSSLPLNLFSHFFTVDIIASFFHQLEMISKAI